MHHTHKENTLSLKYPIYYFKSNVFACVCRDYRLFIFQTCSVSSSRELIKVTGKPYERKMVFIVWPL